MSNISKPFVTRDDPDRHIRCQDALQFAFAEILAAAVAAGWDEREALEALATLTENLMAESAAKNDAALLTGILRRML
jgi:hypothetical protein